MVVSGTGFPPGTPIEALLFSDPVRLGTTTADANRNFRMVVTIPLDTSPGVHTLRVQEIGTGLGAQTTLVVTAPPAAPPRTGILSRTGGSVAGIAKVALALILGGMLFVKVCGAQRRQWPPLRRSWP